MSERSENDSFKLLELKLNLEGNMADKIQNAYKTSKNILAKKGRFSPAIHAAGAIGRPG